MRLMSLITDAGLSIEYSEVINLSDRFLEVIYSNLLGKHFYKDLRDFMVSGPSMAVLASGTDAVETMNRLKQKIRKDHSENWIELTNEDVQLWESGIHPRQTVLNIKLVAANLIHVCDSESESIRCAKVILGAQDPV